MKFRIGDLNPHADFLISKIVGGVGLSFDNPASPQSANEHSITWIKKSKDIEEKIRSTKSSFVVVKETADLEPKQYSDKAILFSENPKLTFARICRKFFEQRKTPTIHPSAFISKEASVHDTTSIGANCVIGKSTIGAHCEIRANTIIGDEVTIGVNVLIDYGAILGSQGFGYYKNQENQIESFPQLGGITIGDDVYIGANTTIDRGTLDDTVIGNGSKIDNLVHIAHNAVIGKNVIIIANSMIAGSVRIKDDSWIAPSASILNQTEIGEGSTVGLGSVVLKNIPRDQTYLGNPARPVKEFLKFQKNK